MFSLDFMLERIEMPGHVPSQQVGYSGQPAILRETQNYAGQWAKMVISKLPTNIER